MVRGLLRNILIVMAFYAVAVPLRAQDVPDPVALDQERKLKDDSEKQAQDICDSIMGVGRSKVLVNVELGLESTHKAGSTVNQKTDNNERQCDHSP